MSLCSPDYWHLASRFLPAHVRTSIRNASVEPKWIDGTEEFWYRQDGPDGHTYRIVTPSTGQSRPAFDHGQLVELLRPYGPVSDTPSESLDLETLGQDGARLRFAGKSYVYRPDSGQLTSVSAVQPGEVVSPDKRWAAWCHDHNIWLRDLLDGSVRALTTDGTAHFSWGKSPDMNLATISHKRHGITVPAGVLWSPDSASLFTYRLDERHVAELPLVQNVPEDGSVRPILHRMRFALSGDVDLPMAHFAVVDAASGYVTPCLALPSATGAMSAIERGEAWWAHDGGFVYYLDVDRGSNRIELREVTVSSGETRTILTESGETFLDTNTHVNGRPCVRILSRSNEFIWFSQRDGWGHLYLYDLSTGALKRQITVGDWLVSDILDVNEEQRRICFQAGGMDPSQPYHRRICSQSLDNADLCIISDEAGDSIAPYVRLELSRDETSTRTSGTAVSPNGRYLVYSNADFDRPPESVLYDLQTKTRYTLEVATREWTEDAPLPVPHPLKVAAADGVTELFGTMWLPSHFDANKTYPSLNFIYPGPQRGQSPRTLYPADPGEFFYSMIAQAFAELGIIVYCIDARGTPGRSKAFHDECFGRLSDPTNLDDQVAGLRQLAHRHSFIDLSRSGIMGHSSGGNAAARAMMLHPDVFSAGISTAGNHDQRGYAFSWTEKYNGPVQKQDDGSTSYDSTANSRLAAGLKGKLFLATGDMDDNVHPCLTMQLVSALICENKDFELLVVPNANHVSLWRSDYFLKRAMGFLVQTLGCNEAQVPPAARHN